MTPDLGDYSSAAPPPLGSLASTLSDGPDPSADPVGYAEAQVRPLRALRISDPALRTAVFGLAADYARVYASNGTSPVAAKAAAAAAKKVNAICPGSAP
jgi:hypothetical protein